MPRRTPPSVYWSEQQVQLPVVQTSYIESNIQQPRTAGYHVVEKHVQMQPQVIRREEIQHVYVPDPVQYIETRTYVNGKLVHLEEHCEDSGTESRRKKDMTRRKKRDDDRKKSTRKTPDRKSERRKGKYRSDSSEESSPDTRSSRKHGHRRSTHKHSKDASSPQREASGPDPTPSFDPYEALGLQDEKDSVDQIEIEATYKALCRKWHPDRHVMGSKEEQDKATDRMAEINRAYDILGDSKRRAIHDRTGKTEIWELDELAARAAQDN